MISIHIEAKDALELQFHVKQLSKVFKSPDKDHSPEPIRCGASLYKDKIPEAEVVKEDAPKKKGPGRPKKSDAVPPKDEDLQFSAQASNEPVKEPAPLPVETKTESLPSKEQVLSQLKKVTDKYGADEGLKLVRQCLQRLGTLKLPDLKPEQYPDLISLCNQVLETGQA